MASENERITIIRLLLAGLFLRLLIMPFTMHFDLLVIEHVSDLFARFGCLAFNPKVMAFYYPPVVYLVNAPFLWLSYLFSPGLSEWLESAKAFLYYARPYDNWLFYLLDVNHGAFLFRNLFLVKLSLLACDLLMGFILAGIVKDRQKAVPILALWAINPAVLHSVFAHGGIDIIPALLVTAALYSAVKGRRILTLVFLVLGSFAKVFPALIILPYILVAEKDLEKRLKLLLIAAVITALAFMFFFLHYGVTLAAIGEGSIGMVADISARIINLARKTGFALCYGGYLVYLFLDKDRTESQARFLEAFLVPLLVLFTFNPIGFRFWVWLSPLVILYLAENREQWPLVAINFLSLFTLRVLAYKTLQLGLFRPLCPEFFALYPGYTDVTGLVFPQFWLLRLVNILFILSSLLLALYVWNRGSVFFRPVKPLLTRVYRYSLSVLVAGLVFLFTIGIAEEYKIRLPETTDKQRDFIITGYTSNPDTLFEIPPGGALEQTLAGPEFSFTTLSLWLESGTGDSLSGTLFTELSWIQGKETSGRQVKTVFIPVDSSGYHNLFFGEIPGGSVSELKLRLVNKGNSGIKAGLISRKGRDRLAGGLWEIPVRTQEGMVILVKTLSCSLDYRLEPTTIDTRWQLALGFSRRVPDNWGSALEEISKRLNTDRSFLFFHLGILGALALAFIGLGVPRRKK